MASLQIDVSGPSDTTVPYAVRLRATDHAGFVKNGPDGSSYDPTYDGIFYEWTVDKLSGPGGSVTQSSPLSAWTNTELNLPNAWRDRNTMYGPDVGFCFDQIGTFRVSLWCIELESGRTAEQTWEVTTTSQEAITQIAAVSNDGNWAGAPIGADLITTADIANWTKVRSGKILILFKGSVVTQHTNFIYVDTGPASIHFGSFGSGNARLRRSDQTNRLFFSNFNVDDKDVVTFSNITVVADWDQTREVGRPTSFYDRVDRSDSSSTRYNERGIYLTIHQCDIGAELTGWVGGESGLRHGTFVHDTKVRNWGGANASYGVYAQDKLTTLLGTSVHADPDACLGSMKSPFQSYGAPYRDVMKNDARTSLACSSFFSMTGWSGGNQPGTAAAQPAIRLGTSTGANARASLDRVVAEGGLDVMSSSEKNLAAPGTRAMNVLMDKLLLVAACNTNKIGSSLYSGVTMRNCIYVKPNAEAFAGTLIKGWDFSKANEGSYTADTFALPVKGYGITAMNLHAGSTMRTTFPVVNEYTDTTFENNAAYNPNEGGSNVVFDLSEPIAGYATLCRGQRFSVEKPSVTLTADIGRGQSFTCPYPVRNYVTSSPVTTVSDTLDASDFDLTEELDQLDVDGKLYQVANGDFTVDMSDPADVTITNMSADTWPSGARALVNLVAKVASNPTIRSAFASPSSIPWPKLAPESQGDVVGGLVPYDDTRAPGTARTAPHDRGAVSG